MPNWAGLSPRGILNLLRPNPSSRRRLRRFSEKILYGGPLRENILVRLLGALHRSQHRRDWILHDGEAPHFYNQRWNGFNFTYGEHRSPAVFTRGFLAAEVIRPGDSLLDIGCGDGFFTKTFFSNDCARIDALDIEPSAVAAARRMNPAPNIDYQLRDAVRDPFPRQNYDVIVWDGAVGHFSADDLETMLSKIAQALAPDGIFVGSETRWAAKDTTTCNSSPMPPPWPPSSNPSSPSSGSASGNTSSTEDTRAPKPTGAAAETPQPATPTPNGNHPINFPDTNPDAPLPDNNTHTTRPSPR